MTTIAPEQLRAIQRRTVAILSAGQVLGGIAFGATVSLGALLAADLSGDDALAGLATASVTRGAAAFAIPRSRRAARRGQKRRRPPRPVRGKEGHVKEAGAAGTP